MLRLTECYVTTSLSPARHNLNDTGTDSDMEGLGAAEAGSKGDGGDHVERYLAECYVETDACFVPASGLRSLSASHTVPGPARDMGPAGALSSATGS